MHTADLMYLHWTEQVLLHYYIIAMRVTVHHDSSTLHHDSSPLHHDSSTLHHDSSTVHHDSSTLHHDSSTLHHDISTSNHDSSTSNHESSTLQHDVSPAQLVELRCRCPGLMHWTAHNFLTLLFSSWCTHQLAATATRSKTRRRMTLLFSSWCTHQLAATYDDKEQEDKE